MAAAPRTAGLCAVAAVLAPPFARVLPGWGASGGRHAGPVQVFTAAGREPPRLRGGHQRQQGRQRGRWRHGPAPEATPSSRGVGRAPLAVAEPEQWRGYSNSRSRSKRSTRRSHRSSGGGWCGVQRPGWLEGRLCRGSFSSVSSRRVPAAAGAASGSATASERAATAAAAVAAALGRSRAHHDAPRAAPGNKGGVPTIPRVPIHGTAAQCAQLRLRIFGGDGRARCGLAACCGGEPQANDHQANGHQSISDASDVRRQTSEYKIIVRVKSQSEP